MATFRAFEVTISAADQTVDFPPINLDRQPKVIKGFAVTSDNLGFLRDRLRLGIKLGGSEIRPDNASALVVTPNATQRYFTEGGPWDLTQIDRRLEVRATDKGPEWGFRPYTVVLEVYMD